MNDKQKIKSILGAFGVIVLIVAFIDFQAWMFEQIMVLSDVSIRFLFTAEAIIIALASLLLYKKVRTYLKNLTFNEVQLSQREREVLENILTGKTNKEIESVLFIERSTLKSHINRIYKKLEVSSRQELINRFSTD